MFNVGGGEFLVIFLVALIVLGPTKLPEVARQLGSAMRELRRISSGFQAEMRSAMEDPVEAMARERGQRVIGSEERKGAGAKIVGTSSLAEEVDVEPTMSTAEAAGMYDITAPLPGSDEVADEVDEVDDEVDEVDEVDDDAALDDRDEQQ